MTCTHRDLAIDAAVTALARLREPLISNADLQRRGRMEIGSGYYTVLLDDEPLCIVHLHTDERFSLTLCPTP